MVPDNFDLTTGVAHVHWSLESPVDLVLLDHASLSEDLIQVVLRGGAIVDVGWYPAFNRNGRFRAMIVVDEDWEAPVYVAECRTIAELHVVFADCLTRARQLDIGGGT